MAAMRRLALLALVACALAVGAAAADASTISWFKTPSKNIYCAWFHEPGSRQSLRCDVQSLAHKAPKPHGCQFDWGSSFGMNATGRASALCVSDSVHDRRAKTLAYGRTRKYGAFSCTSKTTGLRCTNRSGHGFSLNRDRYKLF
jgi:uncharacterized protein DUF6636